MGDTLTDGRRRNFFMIDNDVIDSYVPGAGGIGVYGLAVYSLLVRMSGKNDDAFPSYNTIADRLGISRRQVIISVQKLVDAGLVLKSGRADELGDQESNMYKICDVKPMGGAQHASPVVHNMHYRGAQHAPEEDTVNKTQLKKSSSNEAQQQQQQQQADEQLNIVSEDVAGVAGDAIPSPSIPPAPLPLPPAPSPKPLTEQQRKFQLLCNIVGWDYKLLTKEQTGQIAQTLGVLVKAGYGEEHLKEFFNKVWSKDWRWTTSHSYPTLNQVRAEMGKLKLDAVKPVVVVQEAESMPHYQRVQEKKGFYN